MSSNNDHQPRGQPQEISRDCVPVPHKTSPFESLLIDIAMRLEQTNGARALMYPFADEAAAKGAARAVANMFSRRVGRKHVSVHAGPAPDGSPALYAMRGANYKGD